MLKELLIWGASGHALVVADIIRLEERYKIIAFIDNVNKENHGKNFCGARIIGEKELDEYRNKDVHIIFGFGNCQARLELSKLIEKEFLLATAIHPKAIIANNVSIKEGTVISAGAVINSNSTIGKNVIINTCASVDHECIIEDGVHISPGVNIAGKTSIGQGTWIGIGAAIIDKINIGRNSIIGAGSVVVNNIPDNVLAYGVPAKIIRKINM
jgi:acetyltransferase EpsM